MAHASVLVAQCEGVVVVFFVAGDVLHHANEWREFHVLVARYAFGFENHKVAYRLQVGVEFKELAFPDKTFAQFLDCAAVGVGLLQQRAV